MKAREYYQILGVPKSASTEEINRAYRKLARRFHPDVNKDKDAEERFKEISDAVGVLKDPEKRKLYDLYGPGWQQVAEQPPTGREGQSGAGGFSSEFHFRPGSQGESGDFSSIFENLFGEGARGNSWSGRESPAAMEAEITVSLTDVHRGVRRTLHLQSVEADGLPETRRLQVTIPKGIGDGDLIRLAGQGQGGGDLLLQVRIAPDPRFRLRDHDLQTVVAVSPWEAALGAKIEVETLDGHVVLTVPAGSQNGGTLRLRGKGLAKRDGSRGDLLVSLEVRLPETLGREEKRLFEEMARVSRFTPRSELKQRAAALHS